MITLLHANHRGISAELSRVKCGDVTFSISLLVASFCRSPPTDVTLHEGLLGGLTSLCRSRVLGSVIGLADSAGSIRCLQRRLNGTGSETGEMENDWAGSANDTESWGKLNCSLMRQKGENIKSRSRLAADLFPKADVPVRKGL